MINRALQLFLLVMFTATVVVAQTPTTWSLESEKTEGALSKGDTVRITLKAELEPKWKLYGLEQPSGGPIATTVKPYDEGALDLVGDVKPEKPITKFDPNFKLDTNYYEKTARV